ncbi:MAG TPA: galactose oxidase early set domain-containing protein, partial [Chthoniobacteraceae bacterium]|nr:galactose oxidase early set domain-containing protein [Chthoniobacteraceae bacterium]
TTEEYPHYSETPGYEGIRLMGANGTVTQPGRLDSDMRYARWYPGQITLPGNRIFIYSGWDRDESNYPEEPTANNPTPSTLAMQPFIEAKAANPELYPDLPATAHLAGFMKGGGDNAFLNSRVKQPVPEVYDGTLDKMVALENARFFTGGWYPNSVLIQSGPNRDDWKVGVNDAAILEDVPGGVTDSRADRTYHNMFLVDVQGALKDTDIDTPSVREGKYVSLLAEAQNSHTAFTGSSNVMKLDKLGRVLSHKLTHFGGQLLTNGQSDAIEQIEFAGMSKKITKKDPTPGPAPEWKVLDAKLYQPGRQNYATPLPDGTTVLLGGNGGNAGTLAGLGPWENHSLHLQHYIPADSDSPMAMEGMDMCNKLAKSLIPRDEHGIIQLMPDGTVYLGGQNRNGLVRIGDPAAPLGDSDLGVPCGQIFTPPYLFDPATGQPAERPVIMSGPETIKYGKPFTVEAFSKKGIKSVTLIRTGSMSHSLNTDVRYVKLEFKAGKPKNGASKLTVYAPKLPATAVGGYYYLFVVDNAGVPSIAKVTVVGTEIDKRLKSLKKAGLITAN